MELRALGDRLRASGLTSRALSSWAGTDRLGALPARLAGLRTPDPVPAAASLALFVAGAELPVDRLRALPVPLQLPLDALVEAGLLELAGASVRARVALLPLGRSALVVCDRADAPVEPSLVCWPDDSSYHLASSIPPGRRARWLDLGCGSAFAALARPEAAARLVGVDLNPRAADFARLGLALSGISHAELVVADAAADHGTADLVTCNAPILDEPHAAIWRSTGAAFFARLAAAIPARTAPGGLAILHTTREALPPDLPGERVFVAYAPSAPRFGILWWRPDAPARSLDVHRPLTAARPHLDPRDYDDALADADAGAGAESAVTTATAPR